jgi:type I restriction enzyme S subunit
MSWNWVKIKEIKSKEKYSLVGGPFGSDLSGKHYVNDGGVPVIRGGNLPFGKKFDTTDFVFVSTKKANSLKSNTAYPGDIVFTQRGTLGQVGIVPNDYERYIVSQSQMKLKVNEEKVSALFVYYYFRTEEAVIRIENVAMSSGIPHTNLGILQNFKIPLPSLFIQKRITSILSAYDDLIENNNQRIKLLENMAEEIYKEWFVRFRFPSYKEAAFLDKEGIQVTHGTKGAIPEGWQRKPLDGFNSFSKSDSKLRKFKGEKRYLATADITNIKISNEGEIINWDNKPSRAQLKPEMHSVFFARMSNTYKVLNFTESNSELIEELALTSGFLGLKAKNKACFAYLFSLIKGGNFHNYKDVYANGATQVSLTNEGFHMIRLIEPKIDLIEKYGEIVNPFYDEINILMNKNKILQDTRDLLLPRLISGKLSVEDLELETLHMAAEPQEKYSK